MKNCFQLKKLNVRVCVTAIGRIYIEINKKIFLRVNCAPLYIAQRNPSLNRARARSRGPPKTNERRWMATLRCCCCGGVGRILMRRAPLAVITNQPNQLLYIYVRAVCSWWPLANATPAIRTGNNELYTYTYARMSLDLYVRQLSQLLRGIRPILTFCRRVNIVLVKKNALRRYILWLFIIVYACATCFVACNTRIVRDVLTTFPALVCCVCV